MGLVNRNFSDIFSFTRASLATDFNGAVLASYGNDVVRRGFDPAALLPAGWLLEGASTNINLNPRCEGYSAGSPGTPPTSWAFVTGSLNGLTRTIIAGGTEDGIPYLDLRYAGVATVGFSILIALGNYPVVTGDTGAAYTLSAYCRLLAGSLEGITGCILSLQENTADNATFIGAISTTFTPTTSPLRAQRVSATRTLTNPTSSTLRAFINLAVANGAAVDFTLRVSGAQIEKNYLASSLILPPAGAPAASTRATDTLSIGGSVFSQMFGAGAPQGCVIVDAVLPGNSAQQRSLVQLDPDSDLDRLQLRTNAAGTQIIGVQYAGSSPGASINAGAAVYDTVFRAGIRWGGGQIGVCMNGGAPANLTTTVPAFSTLRFASMKNGSFPTNGRIRLARALSYFPGDAEFQARCTLGA